MPTLTDCITYAHSLLVPVVAQAGDAKAMGDFFKRVYEQLLIPVAAPIGILMFTVGAVMFLIGRRDGVEKMLYAGAALFLIAFAHFVRGGGAYSGHIGDGNSRRFRDSRLPFSL